MIREHEKPTTERQRILCALIPEIDCPDECSLCCSCALDLRFNDSFYPGYDIQNIQVWESDRPACDSFQLGQCAIFHQRPLICRIFWKREDDPPCHGGLTPKHPITAEQFRRLLWCWQFGTEQDARALAAWMKG